MGKAPPRQPPQRPQLVGRQPVRIQSHETRPLDHEFIQLGVGQHLRHVLVAQVAQDFDRAPEPPAGGEGPIGELAQPGRRDAVGLDALQHRRGERIGYLVVDFLIENVLKKEEAHVTDQAGHHRGHHPPESDVAEDPPADRAAPLE